MLHKSLFALLTIFSLSAFAEPVPTLPEVNQVRIPGKFNGSSVDFTKLQGDKYGIVVKVQSSIHQYDNSTYLVYFELADGELTKKGSSLVLTYMGQEKVIARKKRWYQVWLPVKGVKLDYDLKRNTSTGSGFNVYDVTVKLDIK